MPLWYKTFYYKDRNNKNLDHVKEGLSYVYKILKPYQHVAKHFRNILLTNQKYPCNLAVCKDIDADDTWFIINNLDNKDAIREYKKRFDIEEMFRDLKSNGFNLESRWTENFIFRTINS